MYNWTIKRTLARFQHFKWQDRSTRLKLLYAALLLLALLGLFSTVGSHASSRFFGLTGADAYIPSSVWRYRADRVKQAVQHAYRGYEDYAFPQDELRPITGTGMNLYNGWGVTAFDSLDTLYLLGLQDEFNRALKLVERADFRVVTNLVRVYCHSRVRASNKHNRKVLSLILRLSSAISAECSRRMLCQRSLYCFVARWTLPTCLSLFSIAQAAYPCSKSIQRRRSPSSTKIIPTHPPR
jgi:Glycosyl hydrolase family 47